MAQSMGFCPNLPKKPYFESFLWPNRQFLGLATFSKVDSLIEMCNFSFIKFSQKLGVWDLRNLVGPLREPTLLNKVLCPGPGVSATGRYMSEGTWQGTASTKSIITTNGPVHRCVNYTQPKFVSLLSSAFTVFCTWHMNYKKLGIEVFVSYFSIVYFVAVPQIRVKLTLISFPKKSQHFWGKPGGHQNARKKREKLEKSEEK